MSLRAQGYAPTYARLRAEKKKHTAPSKKENTPVPSTPATVVLSFASSMTPTAGMAGFVSPSATLGIVVRPSEVKVQKQASTEPRRIGLPKAQNYRGHHPSELSEGEGEFQKKWALDVPFVHTFSHDTEFTRGKKLTSQGSQSRVFSGQEKKTKTKVIIKQIKVRTNSNYRAVLREVVALRTLEEAGVENVVRCRGVFKDLNSSVYSIVLNYIPGGELFKALFDEFSATQAAHTAVSLAGTLTQTANAGVFSRDLKLENIFLDTERSLSTTAKIPVPVVGDFGFARSDRTPKMETVCGSPHYAAPEILAGEAYDPEKAEIWSFSVILYALFAKGLPFFELDNGPALLEKIRSAEPDYTKIPPALVDLIKKMRNLDPSKRPSMAEVATELRSLHAAGRLTA